MQKLYNFKGTVDEFDDLSAIENPNTGDVYNCKTDLNNYVWNGTEWISIGQDSDFSELLESLEKLKEYKYRLKLTSNVNANTDFTIPCKYKVGQATLDVYLNGERLILSSDDAGTDGHYREVGANNSISNQIKTTSDWSLSAGDMLDFIVRGDYSET